MTDNHTPHDQTAPDPAAALRTSGWAGLIIVAAGMGLLAAIGLVRRLTGRTPPEGAGNAGQPPEPHG